MEERQRYNGTATEERQQNGGNQALALRRHLLQLNADMLRLLICPEQL